MEVTEYFIEPGGDTPLRAILFQAHGRFATIFEGNETMSVYGLRFLDLESADPLETVFGPVNDYDTGINAGEGCGSLVSYRHGVAIGHGEIERRNYVTDLLGQNFPTGTLSRYGATWIFDDTAYVLNSNAIWIHGLQDVVNPVLVGSMQLGSCEVIDVALMAESFLVLCGDQTMQVWDVSDESSPQLRTTVALPFAASCITVGERYAILCCDDNGVLVIDLIDPAQPSVSESTIELVGPAVSAVVEYPYCYVACQGHGIVALKIESSGPVLLPGLVVAQCSELSLGSNGIYSWHSINYLTKHVTIVPRSCVPRPPLTKSTWGSLKSLYR